MPKPLVQLRNIRLEKLEKIRQLGIDPYPARSVRKESIAQARQKMGKKTAIAGRIMAQRGHGGILFFDLQDESAQVQIVFKKDLLGQKQQQLVGLLDIGDFIDISGKVFKTKAGELSVEVKDFHLLTKSLRPLPEKREGLKDPEIIFRQRYLDLTINPGKRDMFRRKARFWRANREFLNSHGFIEVEVPVLEHRTGGADARPFITHMNVLDQTFYLRISTELYQKRLIGGGFEKVFTLGPNFRNEGIDEEHLPEYYACEWYWAYADYRDNMKLVKEMFRDFSQKVWHKTKFNVFGYQFDLAKDWEEIDYCQVIKKRLGIDVFKDSQAKMLKVIQKEGVELDGLASRGRLIDNLWKIVRKDIAGPAFLVNEPKMVSPLAKSRPDDPLLTERFHVIIAGRELGNGYTELNDPLDQLERFREQESAREKGDEEAQMMDIDFVEMLEYGMPPTSGYGQSERIFWTLEGVTAREATLFPAMREKVSDATRAIYGIKKPKSPKKRRKK